MIIWLKASATAAKNHVCISLTTLPLPILFMAKITQICLNIKQSIYIF